MAKKFCRICKTKKCLSRLAYCLECALELLGKSVKIRKAEAYKKIKKHNKYNS